jgi:hypothetical protein
MANKNPLESVMGFTVSADVTQALGEFDKLNSKIKESEDNVKSLTASMNSFEGAGKSFTDGMLSIFGKIASVIEMVILAPAKLDNFMGVMNQRITMIGGELERYRSIVTSIHETALGISVEDKNRLMAGFVGGATGAEKYGAGAEGRAAGYAAGGAQLMRGMGLSAETSGEVLTSLRKNVGLVSAEMSNYSKQLSAIGRTSNMTSAELAKQVKNSIGLARAYGLAGKGGQEFILTNMRISSAVSQMGLNVEATMKKLHEVSTGSEEGLIQSLLMGFQPGDTEGALGGFQNMAKFISGRAAGTGQAEPYLIRQMADQLGMKQFSVEDIKKMAEGIAVEGEKGDTTQKDMVSLLGDIKKALTDPQLAKESPYNTAANLVNDMIGKLTAWLENTFKPLLDELKGWLVKFTTELVPTLNGWVEKFKDFFGEGIDSLKGLAIAVGGTMIALSLAKKGIEFLITKAFGLAGKAVSGAAGGLGGLIPKPTLLPGIPAGTGLAATMGTSVSALPLGTILLSATAAFLGGAAVGLLIDWLTDKVPFIKKAKEWISDKAVDFLPDSITGGKAKTDKEKFSGTTTAKYEGKNAAEIRAMRLQKTGTPELSTEILKGIDIAKREGFGGAKFTTTEGTHKEGSQHPLGKAFDVGTKGFSATQVAELKKKLEKEVEGLKVIDETDVKKGQAGGYGKDWSGPHLHAQLVKTAEDASKTAVAALTPAQKAKVAPASSAMSLTSVADIESHRLLSNVHGALVKLTDYMIHGGTSTASNNEGSSSDNLAAQWSS